MEGIMKCLEKALHFVSVVQNACDDHRQYLEQNFKRNYGILYEEWKKTQKRSEITEAFSASEGEHTESACTLEIEELFLADQLLQKARRIREKLKVPFAPEECISSEKKNVNQQLCAKMEMEDLAGKDKFLMKHDLKNKGKCATHSNKTCNYSKHSLADQPNKSIVIHKQKVSKCVKSVSTTKKLPNCKNSQVKQKLNMNAPYRKLKTKSVSATTLSAISKHDLHHYRNMQIGKEKSKNLDSKSIDKNLTVKELIHNIEVCTLKTSGFLDGDNSIGDTMSNKSMSIKLKSSEILEGNETSKTICKDTVDVPHEIQLEHDVLHAKKDSDCRTFHNMISDKLKEQRNVRPDSSWIWYPFLNSQNEKCLSTAICCKDNEELKKACTLFHGIQETMLWIDLVSLLGNEILPHLQQLDKNDENTAVIRSYLQSILCEDLKQTPVVLKH